jgi:hypothetical protein
MRGADTSAGPARAGWPIWQTVVGVLGVTLVLMGVALGEGGVAESRWLMLIGLPLSAIALVGGLMYTRRKVIVDEPTAASVDMSQTMAALVAQSGLAIEDDKLTGVVKGKRVDAVLVTSSGPLRVTALLDRELDLGLSVTRGQPPGDARPRIRVDDAAFENVFWTCADQAARVQALLTARLKELLLATENVAVEDRGARLDVPLDSIGNLRDTLKVAARMANELERASTKAPCADALADVRQVWLDFAEEHALATADTPLSMWGQIEGVSVRALSIRDAYQHYHFEMTADFPEPLGRGLKLRPASSSTQFDRSGEPVGHPAFDKVFLLKSTDPVDAARLIGSESREAFLQLRDSGLQLRANDKQIWAWAALNINEPDRVPRGLFRMVTLVKRISDNAERFPPSSRRGAGLHQAGPTSGPLSG